MNGNGFKIQSWRDLASLMTAVAVGGGAAFGLIQWGLKLDDRTASLQQAVSDHDARIEALEDER